MEKCDQDLEKVMKVGDIFKDAQKIACIIAHIIKAMKRWTEQGKFNCDLKAAMCC